MTDANNTQGRARLQDIPHWYGMANEDAPYQPPLVEALKVLSDCFDMSVTSDEGITNVGVAAREALDVICPGWDKA